MRMCRYITTLLTLCLLLWGINLQVIPYLSRSYQFNSEKWVYLLKNR